MKIANNIIGFSICFLFLISCDFSEENYDKESTTEASLEELFNPAITQIAFNQSSQLGWSPGMIMQYLDMRDANVNQPFKSYYIPAETTDNFWTNGIYTGSLRHINELRLLAEKNDNQDLQAISIILQVNEILLATSIFGDVPFTEAIKGRTFLQPVYDTQESIYEELLSMAQQAIDMIQSNGKNNELEDIDILFNGDMQQWKKFAFGLKARTHLQLSKKNPFYYQLVLESIENSFISLEEQANYTWTHHNQIENPFFTFNVFRPSLLVVSNKYANSMIERNDPRFELTTQPSGNSWLYQQDSPYNFHWSASNTTLPILSYTELCFMEAEALLMTGASDDEILNVLSNGIESSCKQMNLDISEYEDYLETQSSFNGLMSSTEKLEHIITEAYFAYYGYAFQQSWNNYRRLGIPKLEPTGFANETNPSGNIPVRYPYPQIELELNTENVNEAMERQNGALLDEPLWIFK